MATPQQQPQQPIYPNDLNLALDRNFTKLTSHTNARYEELAAQIRLGNSESLARDTDLANVILRLTERVSNVENTQKAIIATLEKMQGQMTAMQGQITTIQEQIKDGFAAQAERHNDLMVRVDKMECYGHS